MNLKKWGLLAVGVLLLFCYNAAQPGLLLLRTFDVSPTENPEIRAPSGAPTKLAIQLGNERYGPSMDWLDRLMSASAGRGPNESDPYTPHLDAHMLTSVMLAGLASGFKSQVANLLWMKADEYSDQGFVTRQNPLMEMVVTLDPHFIDAWSTAGWQWAYNVYADIPTNALYTSIHPKSKRDKAIRVEQERDINVGLDYLERGSNMNPDTYRLWFEWGWTRAQKAGLYDEKTIALYRKAREQPDAREIERQVKENGTLVTVKEKNGLDIVGHTIAHTLEGIPNIDEALYAWGNDLLKGNDPPKVLDQELAELRQVGVYWRRYGSDYQVIASMYTNGDPVMKAKIKQLVPDVDQLVAAQKVREKMQLRASTPTGAYITISARYLPAWDMMKAGKLQAAVDDLIGVMNVNPKYHLTQLDVMAKIYALRGDAPDVVTQEIANQKAMEKSSSQNIGIHFLAMLYEKEAAKATNPKVKKDFLKLAYQTWYRSRLRDQLDFYALRKTREFQDKYGFTAPQSIVEEIKKSRKTGTVNAAPQAPPNVQRFYQPSGT
ncbi:MAG: hypothetical protein ABI210_00755 [Abditibacteriaceae bacterium]